MVTYGEATIVIRADASRVPKDIEQQTAPQTQKAGLGLAAALGAGLKRGALVAGAGVAAILGYSITKGFERLTAIDQAKAKLTGLGHSAKTVQLVMKNALDSVRGTAFGLGDAATVAATTVAAGIKPGKELRRILGLIADTATISGTSMKEVGTIFNQVAAKGRVQADELLQLNERGIPAIAFLAKSLGKTSAEVLKLVEQGKVSFPQFARAMELGLGGAAKSSGTTFMGALKNVQAAIGRFGAGLISSVFAQMPGIFQGIIPSIDALTPKAEALGKTIGIYFSRGVTILKQFAAEFRAGTGAAGALREVLTLVGAALLAVVRAGVATVTFLREHTTTAKALGAALAYLVVVTQAHAAAMAVQTGGGIVAMLTKYLTSVKLVQVATAAWTAQVWLLNTALAAQKILLGAGAGMIAWLKNLRLAQTLTMAWTKAQFTLGVATWALNTAMAANPIGLVVIAIAALVAAVIVAWRTSETFRNVVKAVWAGIKVAIGATVSWLTGTAVPAVVRAWNAIWEVLKDVGNWINRTLGPWFKTFYAIIEAVFKAAVILIRTAWVLSIKPQFQAMMAALRVLGDVFQWLYRNIIKPVFSAIYSHIRAQVLLVRAIWTGVLQPALRVLGDLFKWLYNNVIKPVWSGIRSVISSAWSGIQPVFSAIRSGVSAVRRSFEQARDGIRVAWNALEGIAKRPIKFVIQTVLNNGLIKAFNWLGKRVGGPHIDNIPMPFASGGVLPGYTPGRDIHRFFSPTGGILDLSGGEAVMRPEFVRAVGGARGVAQINALAKRGLLPGEYDGYGAGAARHAMAGGGVIDWIKKQGASAFGWVSDTASSVYKAITHPLSYLKSKIPTVPSEGLGAYARPAVGKLVDSAADKLTSVWKAFKSAFGASGGALGGASLGGYGWSRMMDVLRQRFPGLQMTSGYRPGAITATGNRSYHSMGRAVDLPPRMDVFNWLRSTYGRMTKELIFSPAGNRQIHNGRDHLYSGVVRSMHWNHVHWAMKNGGIVPQVFDRGGVLPPGISAVQNNTGRPEPLVRADMIGAGTTYVEVKLSMDDLRQLKTLEDFLGMLERSRMNRRRTERSGVVTA